MSQSSPPARHQSTSCPVSRPIAVFLGRVEEMLKRSCERSVWWLGGENAMIEPDNIFLAIDSCRNNHL
jgi:hypothetical protein